MLRSCFLSHFLEFRSAVSEEKSTMPQPIRGQGGHLVFFISPKNTNLVEDIDILLPVKFRWIAFSGFRGEVENVSANQRPRQPSCFSDWPELKAQGPFIAHLITNSKQFSQKRDNQNDRIQINACVDSVVGNTSVCYCEHDLVWRRISSKEKPFLYHFFAPPWIQPLEYLAETATRTAAFQVRPFLFEALFDSFLPCLGSTPGWIW